MLQIDCSFPYLAVCTLVAVFLCDLEKEDFTRVQCTKNTDIRSTGLCLMILPERSSLRDLAKERTIPSAKLMLFIGEVGSGTIHCCNMEGSIQHSKRIAVSEKVSKYSMPLFDPTKAASIPQNGQGDEDEDEEPVSISLGKMLCTDDGMIVSVSSDRLYVYDPYTLNVIAWNEDFKRINNFKIISNYAFVWAGSKLDVVAFTPFRSYAEQLYRAKLLGVLESWIVHTVYSLGWRRLLPALLPPLLPAADQQQAEEEGNAMGNCDQEKNSSSLVCVKNGDKNQQKAVSNFRKMLFSEGDEESEFTQFVADHVPFPILLKSGNPGESDGAAAPEELGIIMTSQEDVEEATLERPITTFLKDAQSIFAPLLAPSQIGSVSSENMSIYSTTATVNNDIGRISSTLSLMLKISEKTDFLQLFSQVWKSLLVFYEDIEVVLPQLDYKKSDLTLSHILHASSAFLQQPKLVNLHERIEQVGEMVKFEDIVIRLISCLYCPGSSYNFKKCSSSLLIDPQCPSNTNLFMLCFTKFTHCPLVIQWFRELGTSHETLFYDGLLADTLLLLFPLCSYKSDGLLLASCLDSIGIYDKLPKFFMTWLFLCRYLHKPKQVPYSPLLRSLLNAQLFEKLAEEMFSTIYRDFRLSSFGAAAHYLHHFVSALVLLSKSPDCGHPRNVSILISCFPLTKWAREDIVTKVIAACHLNPALLGLYLKACLEDGHSMKLCACGIQAGYGNLEEKIPAWQRAIEEAIIKLLLEEYFKSNPYDDENEEGNASVHDGNGNDTQKRRAEMLVHMFAMRRGLLEPYFRSPLPDEFLSEEVQAELIVRSGSCASLKYYQCNEQNMSLLLRSYQCHNFQRKHKNCTKDHDGRMKVNGGGAGEKNSGVLNVARNSKDNKIQSKSSGHILTKCFKCNYPLKMFNRNFKPMSRDCLGMWALKQTGSLQGLIEIVQRSQLNVPSNFSARFEKLDLKTIRSLIIVISYFFMHIFYCLSGFIAQSFNILLEDATTEVLTSTRRISAGSLHFYLVMLFINNEF